MATYRFIQLSFRDLESPWEVEEVQGGESWARAIPDHRHFCKAQVGEERRLFEDSC